MKIMKKLKCKKQFGNWYYKIKKPSKFGTCALRFPVYLLIKEDGTDGGEFGSYGDMKHYVETGEIL